MLRAALRTSVVLVVVFVSGACARVAPYERGRLAHPTMAKDYATSAARAHVRAIHEGAVGGDVEATAGCGCN